MDRKVLVYSGIFRNIATKKEPSIPSWVPSFLSKESLDKRTEQLRNDLKKGYFHDMHEFRRTNGKLFHAKASSIPAKESIKFPDGIVGKTLYGRSVNIRAEVSTLKPKATMVALSHNALSYEQTSSFTAPFIKEFSGIDNFTCYELIVIEKWILYSFLLPWMWINNWNSTPRERMQFKLFKLGSSLLDDVDKVVTLGNVSNKLVGYIWLLDSQGRIRWMATGTATDQELSNMKRIASEIS